MYLDKSLRAVQVLKVRASHECGQERAVIKKFLGAYAVGLLLVGGALGYVVFATNQRLERTVTELFNNQQLILARQIAQDITNHFLFLETQLKTVSALSEVETLPNREPLEHLHGLVSEWNVLATGFLRSQGKSFAITSGPALGAEDLRFLHSAELVEWSLSPEHAGMVRITRDFVPDEGVFDGRRILLMFTTSTEENGAEGVFFIIDPLAVAQRYARDVRSGETGYAWVINEDAVFLSHYEEQFINLNSLNVREQRNPDIPYDRINRIVTDNLLHGMEGTDWYISGWHRGIISRMKKLLAYSPVRYAGTQAPDNLWSVALAAPTTEVYGMLQPLLYRGWLITGVSLLLVFSGLAWIIYFSLRWAQLLKTEVDRKTADLRQSEAEVRVERDRVKESMSHLLQAQEKLLRSERFAAIGEAAAHLAHEIKNPLLLMGGFAAQVRRQLPVDSKHRQKLEVVESEAKRLENMLMEVQNFTRPAKPQKEMQDINREIEDIISLMENDLRQKGIMVVKNLDETLPLVEHDPRQIRQVLLNLAKNAGEAITGAGRITFSSWQENGRIKVSVNDTGVGMSREVLENLFRPFYTTKVKGTGLGLVVCSRIIEDHGGEISASSVEGRGSTFTITLPAM
jgi:two-component system, NtrC family, sensor histidine kinase HydH